MKVAYFGSGAFGLPTLEMLLRSHEVAMGVTQPDRPAGRGRAESATAVGERLAAAGVPLLKPRDVNDESVVASIRGVGVDAFVVIAFGQKLGPGLLQDRFAINLHASLLPRHRGAAPVNWAILSGDERTGVTVITLAQRMDAGEVLCERIAVVDPMETAGELHDRLAALGPEAVEEVLRRRLGGTLAPRRQEERAATRAPKLSRADAWVRFDRPAAEVQRRIHGLSPWPGCAVRIDSLEVKLLRVATTSRVDDRSPGEFDVGGSIACAAGAVVPVEVQPSGGRPMSRAAFLRGHAVAAGTMAVGVVPLPAGAEEGRRP